MAEKARSWSAALAMLQYNDAQAVGIVHRWQIGITVTRRVLYILTAGAIVWALIELRVAWHSGRWDGFWEVLRTYPLFLFAAPLSSVVMLYESLYDTSRTLREAALRGDDHEAPLAQKQPESSVGGTVLVGETRYSRLNPPNDGRGAGARALSIMALCVCFIAGIITALLVVTEAGTPLVLIAGSAAVPFLLLAIWLFVLSARQRRRITVMADDMGIAWKVAGWRARIKRIAWHDAQAFVVMHPPQSGKRGQDVVWVLIGPDATLIWTDPHEAASREDTPHVQFAALVAARTRLPLRDLSALAEKVAHGLDAKAEEIAHPLAVLVDAAEKAEAHRAERDIGAKLHTAPETHARPGCRSIGVGCLVQIVLMLAILLLYPIGWGLQQYQPRYYAGLLAQIHASKPLYHDALTYDDGGWDVVPPTATDGARIFKDGAYHVTGTKGYTAYSWPTFEHDDAAVEVTAQQIGSSDSDGVGLVLRSSINGSDMVTFYVDSTGYWWLTQYHFVDDNPDHEWTTLGYGQSDAIYTGKGAENRLLVLMRGGQYICFVNDQLVATYSDDTHETPHSGYMGVYLNEGSLEGVFTNFTVYSAPPPSIWSAL